METVWNSYRLWTRKIIGYVAHDSQPIFDDFYSPTDKIFRARTHKEAKRDAAKYCDEAELCICSFIVVIDWAEQKGEAEHGRNS